MSSLKIAWVLEYDDFSVKCVTPCCGKIVFHGSCRGDILIMGGPRSPHCNCVEEYEVKVGKYTKKVVDVKLK